LFPRNWQLTIVAVGQFLYRLGFFGQFRVVVAVLHTKCVISVIAEVALFLIVRAWSAECAFL
jgi:hypothetical protein